MFRLLTLSVALVVLAGCAGRLAYTGPAIQPPIAQQKVIDQPFERVWASTARAFEGHNFVLTSADRASGIMALSFSGHPQQYLDCGQVESVVYNPRAQFRRTYRFPASSAHETYEQLMSGNLYDLDRSMELQGTVNVLLERIDRSHTRATIQARYDLTRTVHIANVAGKYYEPVSDTISFTTHSAGTFHGFGRATQCVATGQLEYEVMRLVS